MTLLFLTCLALGVLSAWGVKQRRERARLSERNFEIEKAYVTVLAKRDDLAVLLTDPRTHLLTLRGRDAAAGASATVAWLEQTHTGVLVGNRMPLPGDGRVYALWHVDAHGTLTRAATFRPADSAATIREFQVLTQNEGTAGFRVTAERETDRETRAPGGDTVYQTAAPPPSTRPQPG
jgi:hypothetical protein